MEDYIDLDTYVISPENSNEESDEVEFVSETRQNSLPLNKDAKIIDTKRPNMPVSDSKDCLVTDGIDELLRQNNMIYIYAYESKENTDKETNSISSGASNNIPPTHSKTDHSHEIIEKSLTKSKKDSKYKVVIYEISDDDDDESQKNSSLTNKSTNIKISGNTRNVNNIGYNIQQDENMNDLPEDVIIEEINRPGNINKYDLNTIKVKTASDCIINSKDKDQEFKMGKNKVDSTGFDENWNRNHVTDEKFIQRRKKRSKKKKRQTSIKRKRKSKIYNLTPVTDLNLQNIFSTSEEEDTEVEAVADNENYKFSYETVKREKEPTNESVPRSTSAMSLINLLDFYSDDVEKVIQGVTSEAHKPHIEDSELDFAEAEDDCENCKSCSEKFEPLQNSSVSQCAETKQDDNSNNFSEISKTEKEQPCGDSIEDEIEKILTWSLELSKGMLPNAKPENFERQSLVKEKKKLINEKDDGPFICPLCNKLILIQSNLKQHIRLHVAGTLFHCKYCKEGFLEQNDLDKHINASHHLHKLVCDFCQRPFISVNSWLHHMKIAHPEVEQYTCHLCKMVFDAENKYRKHMSEHRTDVIKESLQLLKEMKKKIPLRTHSKKHKSPKAPQLPLFGISKDSVKNVSSNRNVSDTKSGSTIPESKEQTVIINVPEVNQIISEHETSGKGDLNPLDVETFSNVDVNETQLVDFDVPQFETDHFNSKTKTAYINNKNIQKHHTAIEKLNNNQTVLPNNYLQAYVNYINQTNYNNEEDPLDGFNLNDLNKTNKMTQDSTQTCNVIVNEIELGDFSKNNDKIMLGLVDLIKPSPIETTELVTASQPSTQYNVDANRHIMNNDPSLQVMNLQENNELFKIDFETKNKISDSDDTSCDYIQNVDSIEPMNLESIEIESRMQDYVVSGLGDLDLFQNHAEIPTNKTESVEINIAGQNLQIAQSKDKTFAAPISNLVAQTNPAQNFIISSLLQPQGILPAPEQYVTDGTLRVIKLDQAHTLNGATNANVVNRSLINVPSGTGGVKNIILLYV